MTWDEALITSAQDRRLAENVVAALRELVERDGDLFAIDVNERTLAHRLAVYLERRIPDLHVDCEYNRHGHQPKRLHLAPEPTTSEDTEGTTVFPDIILHRRGENGPNVLAIEIKKTTSSQPADRDFRKLEAMRRELKYTHALFVRLETTPPGGVAEARWL